MYSTDYMDRVRTCAGTHMYSATKSDVHVHAKKRMPSEKRAASALAATSRLLRRPGALPIVEETVDESAREKRRWGPDGARQRPRRRPS